MWKDLAQTGFLPGEGIQAINHASICNAVYFEGHTQTTHSEHLHLHLDKAHRYTHANFL